VALGFGAIPGLFSILGEFARVAGTTAPDLEDQGQVAAVVIASKKPRLNTEEGTPFQ
jgi:hypothetical protein